MYATDHSPFKRHCILPRLPWSFNCFSVESISIFSADFSALFSINISGNINPCFTNKWTRLSDSPNSFLQYNYAEYYSSLLVQLKDILKEKRHGAGRSPRVSCSCTTMPRLTGHLQPRRNWLTWASSVLITHPFLRIWPRRTITCVLD